MVCPRVAIGRNGTPCSCPGLRSKVSVWLGPPFIHNKMHERFDAAGCVIAAANEPNHPAKCDAATVPPAHLSQSRRSSVRTRFIVFKFAMVAAISMIPGKFGGVEQHPKDIPPARRLAGSTFASSTLAKSAAAEELLDRLLLVVGRQTTERR